MSGSWIDLADDGREMTCEMPEHGDDVLVKLANGEIHEATFIDDDCGDEYWWFQRASDGGIFADVVAWMRDPIYEDDPLAIAEFE